MGGDIGFESRWQHGTTFWIDLPEAPRVAKPAAPPEPEASPVPEASLPQTRTMLYIEDNPANVLLMEQIARRMSLRFLSAHTAEIGIALALSARPDVIVMDINLPNMNGYEALAQLQANPVTASIPVIALTANAMERDVTRGLQAGFASYSTKPLRVDEMVRTVESALEAA